MKNDMTFPIIRNHGAAIVPAAALRDCGFEDAGELMQCHSKGMMVLLKPMLTAMDIVNAIDGLNRLSDTLTSALEDACGVCDNCESCVYDNPVMNINVKLPDEMLEAMGVTRDSKLTVTVDKDRQRLVISAADYANDLTDVPEEIEGAFIVPGIAVCGLDQHLRKGDVIYGED